MICPQCGKEYSNARSFKRHTKTHNTNNTLQSTKSGSHSGEGSIMQEDSIEDLIKIVSPTRAVVFDDEYQTRKKVKTENLIKIIETNEVDDILLPLDESVKLMEPTLEEIPEVFTNEILEEVGQSVKKEVPLLEEVHEETKMNFDFTGCLMILHQDHTDYLYKGKLYCEKENGMLLEVFLCLNYI